MESIQDLRERRHDLSERARKLIDSNPGNKWNAKVAASVDEIYAEIDSVDRDMRRGEREREAGRDNSGAPGAWVDQSTGREVAIAYANRGSIGQQLRDSFPKRGDTTVRASLGEYLRGIAGLKVSPEVRNALSEGTDSAGGFTLPQYVQMQMIDALAPVSSLLQAGAGMGVLDEGGGGAKSWRIAAMSTIPTAAWRAESGTVATGDPAMRAVDLTPRSLAFLFKVSRELLADSLNLEPALYRVIAQAFAKEMDRAGLRGSGSAPEIKGVLNTSGIQSVTNTANGASLGTTAYANFISAVQALLAADAPMPTAAIMAPRSLTTLGGLLDTTNQPRAVPPMLAGVKFIATSQIPVNLTVGTSSDCSEIYVADFSNVSFFLREGVSIQRLNELYAGTGEVGFACHVRVDLGVLYPAAVAVVTGVRA